jgi:serine/threonine protein kinase/tetratricopeptide (TPR) repeat protein
MSDETIGMPNSHAPTTLPITPVGDATGSIGPYRILQKIGEGGMGEVYLAEQSAPISRRVALKIIKPGMDSREVVARFAAERQAISMMDHPCIARAFDAGTTEQGRPYFVMEYVQGLPITEYCDRNKLGTPERLKLFARVCEGVQHAHQKAIIHRDLKPHNVLVTVVDDQPVPKIIDFGVAKAMGSTLADDTVFTRIGQMIGTPEYMSPEQFDTTGGSIDPRTDIYSLGVILYEMLSGAPPFDTSDFRKDGYDAIRKRIREVDPPKPSTKVGSSGEISSLSAKNRRTDPARLASELRGDLDWITLKALEKDRTRRYPSASELAQDIQRYLSHEPVLATPPSATYRLSKMIRRHRGAVAALAAIFAILVVTAIVSTSLYFRAQRESRRAQEEAARSEQVATFIRDMLAGVGPSVAMGRDTKLLREILEKTSKRVDRDLTGQPRVEAEMRSVLASTYADLGEYDTAQPHLDKSIALFTSELGERDPRTLRAVTQLGQLQYRLGRMDVAESLLVRTLAIEREVVGQDSVQTLITTASLAAVYGYNGDVAKADSLGEIAVAGLRKKLGESSAETQSVMFTLAQSYTDQRRTGAAESLYKDLIRVQLADFGPEHPNLLSARMGLGWTYRIASRLPEAERETREALETMRRVLGNDHAETMVAINNLGIIYNDMGEYAKAEPLYMENVAGGRRVQGERHPEAIASVVNLGSFYQSRGRHTEALAEASKALRLFEGVVPDDFPGRAIAHQIRGVSLVKLGRHAEAEKDLLEANRVLLPMFGPEHRRIVELHKSLYEVYTRLGRADEAAKWKSE